MPYREEEDALRSRVDSLQQEADAEHAEVERLRADLARANAELAHARPAQENSGVDPRPESKPPLWRRLRGFAIFFAVLGAVAGAIVIASWNDGVHGTIFSEGGKLGTWQVAIAKCQSRGGRFDGINFFDGNGVNRARVVTDAKGDTSVWVYKDGEKNWGYRADRPDCSTLDAKLTTPTSSGRAHPTFDGSLTFDCKVANGRVHGALTFKGCHY